MRYYVAFVFGLSLFSCTRKVLSHPQCLDFMPPFRPVGKFQICKQYESFGCCNADTELKISQNYDLLSGKMTQEETALCGNILQSLLCQKCSPYAAHVYDAEDGTKAKIFPGLCHNFCVSAMSNCSFLVSMLTNDTHLINLAEKNVPKFCKAVQSPDVDYCYPNLLTNPRLSDKIGTVQFYQNKESPKGHQCLRMCVEEVANRLRNPVSAKHSKDGTHRLFVVEQLGIIWIFLPDRSRLDPPFLNMRQKVLKIEHGYDERGMLDIAFHPNYKNNGLFYIFYTILIHGYHHIKISEMKVSSDDMNQADLNSERTLLTVREPAFNHNGGQLIFGDDGYLYIFIGDGGAAGDPFGVHGNGQNKKVFLGKVLRIDVNSESNDGFPYSIPDDNPFVNDTDYLPEIYALGVRNMWRCSKDRGSKTGLKKGRIFCGDVGQSRYEEINIIEKGGNYGWRAYEGYSCYDYRICNKRFVENYVRPIHVYSHAVGKSVTGGYVYRGCQSPNLYGKYIFGDYTFGKLFLLKENAAGKWIKRNICMGSDNMCNHNGLQNSYAMKILAFGEDESGEIYILSTTNPIPGSMTGSIYKLVDPARRGDPSICAKDMVETVLTKDTKKIPYARIPF